MGLKYFAKDILDYDCGARTSRHYEMQRIVCFVDLWQQIEVKFFGFSDDGIGMAFLIRVLSVLVVDLEIPLYDSWLLSRHLASST